MQQQKIQDRFQMWHSFDPTKETLRYPASHTWPEGSKAALLHFCVENLVTRAFNDIVTENNEYWCTGERDAWFNRVLMSEVLPGYLVALGGGDGFIIDIIDIIESMIEVAEYFSPEFPEDDDEDEDEEAYFFQCPQQRERLTALRDRHLAALRKLRATL